MSVKAILMKDQLMMKSACTILSRLGHSYLATIVGQVSFWRIFSKIELVERRRFMEDRVIGERVRTITTFLSTLEDSYAIFWLLHQMIYQRYPATLPYYPEQDRITVSFPSSPSCTRCLALACSCWPS